jgi:hypothetical protein
MLQQVREQTKLLAARFKIERATFPIVPKFKTTFYSVWIVALIGLFHGRLLSPDGGQSLSLLLTLVAWIVALFFIMLHEPWDHLKRFVSQVFALVLLLGFIIAIALGYQIVFITPIFVTSIKIAWIVCSVLLGYLAIRALTRAFGTANLPAVGYPGMRSAPLLFFIWIGNVVWWYWPHIVGLLNGV